MYKVKTILMKFILVNFLFIVFSMESTMASFFDVNYENLKGNKPQNLKELSDREIGLIKSKFLGLDFLEKDEFFEIAYIPVDINLSGKFEKDILNIQVIIENKTDNVWFIPSPFEYYGNKFLTLEDKSGTYYYPNKVYKHRVVTNDSTIWVIKSKDKINIKYQLSLSNLKCGSEIKLFIEHGFLPSSMIDLNEYALKEKGVRLILKSNNYLLIDCKNKEISSYQNY